MQFTCDGVSVDNHLNQLSPIYRFSEIIDVQDYLISPIMVQHTGYMLDGMSPGVGATPDH